LKINIDESRIYGVELADDMLSIAGAPGELLQPSQEWEYKSYMLSGNRLWSFRRNPASRLLPIFLKENN
jgi:hypothetical protein